VLDDYHLIDAPAIHSALAFLIDHLPPQLHLMLTTRADPPLPLTRLRAQRNLTELRAIDLRFTADETAAFLTELMGLPLSADDVIAPTWPDLSGPFVAATASWSTTWPKRCWSVSRRTSRHS
jgi:LuxR family maltose regulon positive regulatory protein